MTPPQSANADSSPYAGEPFGKWYAVGSSTAQKPPVMPPFFKGRWHGVSRGGGIQKGGGTAQAVTEGLTPLSRLAPAAFHNSQWSFRCAHKFACGSPLFIGLTSRCFAHSARASCAPLGSRGAFWIVPLPLEVALPKASFFPKGKGRWRGVSRDGGIAKSKA